MSARRDFLAGVKTMTPLMVGIAPFGMVSGVAAVNIGLTPLQAMGMSVIVFAGTSQLAAIELLGQDVAAPIVVLTILVVNARLVMYSASIGPYLRGLSTRWRCLVSYLLTDHVYALVVTETADDARSSTKWYVFGLGFTLWAVWQVCSLVGIFLGTTVPDRWGMDFVVPLTFLALLVPELKGRMKTVTALAAGTVAVTGAGIPMSLGLILGAVSGIVLGTTLSEVFEV